MCCAVLAALLAVSGCATAGSGSTGLTPVARTNYAAETTPVAGVAGGGLIGALAGDGLNRAERITALEAEYRTLESTPGGQKVTWKGRNDRTYGEVVAAQPYRVGSQDCRQYAHTAIVDGRPLNARGTACRNPDGSWTPLS
jgi:surface antigen